MPQRRRGSERRRDTGQIASCLIEDRLKRRRLAAGMPLECESDREQQDAARPDVPLNEARAPEAPQLGEPRPAARQEAAERPEQGGLVVRDIVELVPHRSAHGPAPGRTCDACCASLSANRRQRLGAAVMPWLRRDCSRPLRSPAHEQAPAPVRSACRHGEAAGPGAPHLASANSSKPCSLRRISKG